MSKEEIQTAGLFSLDPTMLIIDDQECGPSLNLEKTKEKFPFLIAQNNTIRYDLLSVLVLVELRKTIGKFNALLNDYKLLKQRISVSENQLTLIDGRTRANEAMYDEIERLVKKYINT